MPAASTDPAHASREPGAIHRRDLFLWRKIVITITSASAFFLGILAALPSAGGDRPVWAAASAGSLLLMIGVRLAPRQLPQRGVWAICTVGMVLIAGLTAASDHLAAFPYFFLVVVLSGAYLLPRRQSIAMSFLAGAALFVALEIHATDFDLLLFLQVAMVNSCCTVLTRALRRGRDALIAELEAIAAVDGLTGIANRGTFEHVSSRLVERARLDGTPLSLVMFDIDHFKALNDRHGHAAGDVALRGFATILTQHSRPTDLIARVGGEEFVAVMPGATASESGNFATRVGAALRSEGGGPGGRITVSAGVATLGGQHDAASGLMRDADRALYAAKAAGRDRVVFAGDLDTGPVPSAVSQLRQFVSQPRD